MPHPHPYCSYSINTINDIDKRRWEIIRIPSTSLHSHGHHDNQELAWSTERVLDRDNGEIIEHVVKRLGDLAGVECSIHLPLKGWYLLIRSSNHSFIQDQIASSSTSASVSASSTSRPHTPNTAQLEAGSQSHRASHNSHAGGKAKGNGKDYVNLIPSRTNPSTDFKFYLGHGDASSSSPSASIPNNDDIAGAGNGAGFDSDGRRRRRSFVAIDADDVVVVNTPEGWTNFGQGGTTDLGKQDMNARTSLAQPPLQDHVHAHANSIPSPRSFSPSSTSPTSSTNRNSKTSTFLLRPITHSTAKSHIHEMSLSSKPGDNAHHGSSYTFAGAVGAHNPESMKNHQQGSVEIASSTRRNEKRLSLRGLKSFFTAIDNSFELLWANDEISGYIPLLIFEDHPSMLRTVTSGQLHINETLINQNFQPASPSPSNTGSSGARSNPRAREDAYDPVTFFVAVAIAYLGFLEDQEAYKAASEG